MMRWKGLEPLQPKAATGSLILRVCQFRHHRKTVLQYRTIYSHFLQALQNINEVDYSDS